MSAPGGAAPDDLAAAAHRLYGTRPEDFVAARTALVRELRAAKARDAAREVSTWRRPSVADWGLNLLARRPDSPVGGFLEAAAVARAAQARALGGGADGGDGAEGAGPGAGGDGAGAAGDLRAAVRELRAAGEVVVRAADAALVSDDRPEGSQLGPLAARLTEVAASSELAGQLRAGCLGAGAVSTVDVFAGAEPLEASSSTPRSARRSGTTRRSGTATAGQRSADDGELAARRRAMQDQVTAARSALAAVEADRAQAVERAGVARVAAAAARAEEDAARQALAAAQDRRRRAHDGVQAAEASAADLEVALERARASLAAASEALAAVEARP